MSWVNGRQLASASDGTSTYSYIYDAAGSRIMKNVGTVNHLYFYVNGMLLMEYRYNAMGDTTDVLQYFYDANGKPHAMAYNGTVYLYVTNLQGDIVALLGMDGTVSGYEYDPYGNVVASYGDIAAINPLRYRGYYYDNETGLYYLQSRYYDPVVGRFINADSYASTGQGILGCNMFAYCLNNPVICFDSTGSRACIRKDFDYGTIPVTTPQIAETPEDQTKGVINGQGVLPYSDVQIGLGSYGKSGCPYIATYNAMQLIGQPQSLASVTSEVYDYGAVLYGAWGAGPWGTAKYFDAHQIEYSSSFSPSTLTVDISEGSVIVFTVMNNKNNLLDGWHAMTALYTNGEYWVFNRSNQETGKSTYSSLTDAYAGGLWLYGFRIDP